MPEQQSTLGQKPESAAASLIARLEAAERELASLHAQLERQHRLATVGTIAGLIAHEFNNILTPMLGFTQMALARPDDAGLRQRALERAHESGERAAKIAAAILELLRGDDAGVEAAPSASAHAASAVATTSVDAALDRALTCLGRDLERDGITLRREWGGDETTRTNARQVRAASTASSAGQLASREPRDQPAIPQGTPSSRPSHGEPDSPTPFPLPLGGGSEAAPSVAMSSVALEHVLLNLILNARKAMLSAAGARGRRHELVVRARVEARESSGGAVDEGRGMKRVDAGEGMVLIEVEDNGPGMSAERVGRLFSPLEARAASSGGAGQTDDYTKGTSAACANAGTDDRRVEEVGGLAAGMCTSGTGLGMTVCKRLVEQAGGAIGVRSAVGRGTCVWMRVPRGAEG